MGIDETKKENTEARTAREKALTLSIIEKKKKEPRESNIRETEWCVSRRDKALARNGCK